MAQRHDLAIIISPDFYLSAEVKMHRISYYRFLNYNIAY